MLSTNHKVYIKLLDKNLYVTNLDVLLKAFLVVLIRRRAPRFLITL